MQKFYSYLLILLVLCITVNCKKDDNKVDPTLVEEEKQIPEGSRRVAIKVDKKYNFDNVKGYSFVDSTTINTNPGLIVRNGFPSMLYFTDETTGNLLAMVKVDTSVTEVEVNATTVSLSLLELVPTYNEITDKQQQEFETSILATEDFKSFESVVDNILQNRSELFSTDPRFTGSIANFNKMIVSNYLSNTNKGGRIKTGEFWYNPGSWLLQEENVIENQVNSYIRVLVTNEDKSSKADFVMSPMPYLKGFYERKDLNSLPDGYYNMQVMHDYNEVKIKNGAAAAEKVLSLVLGAVVDKSLKVTGAQCREELVNKIAVSLNGIVLKSTTTPTTTSDMQTDLINAAIGLLKDAATSQSCGIGIIATGFLSRYILIKSNYITKIISVLWNGSELVQIYDFLDPFINPVTLDLEMQKHNGNLMPGQFNLKSAIKLDEEYEPKEEVAIQISLKEMTRSSDLFHNRPFIVKWIVKEGHGTISDETQKITVDTRTGSSEGDEWFGNALWTLPDVSPTGNGEVEAIVEILDRQGKHIKGSPVEFKTKIIDSTAIYAASVVGNYIERDNPGNIIHFISLSSDGTATVTNTDGTPWLPQTWKVKRSGKKYYCELSWVANDLLNPLKYPVTQMKFNNRITYFK